MRLHVAATLLLAGLLVAPSPAAAAYDPVSSGMLKLTLAKPLARLLAADGVKIVVTGGARKTGRKIMLPAVDGAIDAGKGTGTVEAGGGIVLEAGPHALPLKRLTFKSQRSPLYAKVGGSKLKLVTGGRLVARREGFGARFKATGLILTPKAATRINRKLHLEKELPPGVSLGTLEAVSIPRTVHLLEQGRLQLALAPAFTAKLEKLFVSVNPIAPAEFAPGRVLSLPIGAESTLAPDGSYGTLKLKGSIELLQLGHAQMFWREAWLQPQDAALLAETDTEPSPPHLGQQPQAPLFSLTAATAVSADPSTRAISVQGQTAVLTSATAAALNEAFVSSTGSGVTFAAGDAVGMLSLAGAAE